MNQDSISSSRKLKTGDRVTVSGLRSAKQYNGKAGTIVSVPKANLSESSRFGVKIDGTTLAKAISVKLSNLTLCNEDCKKEVSEKESTFQVGDRLVLHGLKATKYNGKSAIVIEASDPSYEYRYGARLMDHTRRELCVRPVNMRYVQTNAEPKSTAGFQEERDAVHRLAHYSTEECANTNELAWIRNFVMSNEQHQINLFGRKIDPMPNFRNELLEAGGFPAGVDYHWADNLLRHSFEQASLLPHFSELHFTSPEFQPDQKEIMKRVGLNLESLEWYCSAKPGSINENHQAHPYGQCFRHDFSNQAYRKDVLRQGKTHVAVGFVDLGLLMVANLEPGDGPLHFLGVEQSVHSVAKTHVIWEMLAQIPISSARSETEAYLRSVLQVWFSSTWTEETESRAKAALSSLCSKDRSYHTEVNRLLIHWLESPRMPLNEARKEYASCTTGERFSAGFLKLKRDRIAVARYEISGDFAVGDNPLCGNTIMLDCLDGIPPPALDQSIFAALNFDDVMRVAGDETKTIVDAAEEYAISCLTKLTRWIKTNKVTLELICASFETIIDEISSKRPWTMSWSNLVDYCDYEAFHRMARNCSKHGDTVHFGYSMNWTYIVSGTCLLDYGGEDMACVRLEIIDSVNNSTAETYAEVGWDRRFRLPLPQNPLNNTSLGLEMQYFRKWADYFFGKALLSGPCKIANVEHPIASPLSSSGDSTVAFTWTYDPDISFFARQN